MTLERYLDAIDNREPEVQAFTYVDRDSARLAARASSERWAAGNPLSPIDGLTLGLKDIIDTVDMPTQYGSAMFSNHRPLSDAACVVALKAAGAVIVGKTVTTEFAGGAPGPTRNPHDLTRTPGGSSSGSAAAVGGGMLSAALGTQALGSLLRPASFCGTYAFKPTIGAINRQGVLDLNSRSVVGTLANSLEDAWNVSREIAARVGGDGGNFGLHGASGVADPTRPNHILVVTAPGWDTVEPNTLAAFSEVVDRLDRRGVRISDNTNSAMVREIEADWAAIFSLAITITGWERLWPLRQWANATNTQLRGATTESLRRAEALSVDEYEDALRQLHKLSLSYNGRASDFDVAMTLSAPGVAPVGLESTGSPAFCTPATMLGLPAVGLPLLHVTDLPVGVQVIGHRGRDESLVTMSRWIESN